MWLQIWKQMLILPGKGGWQKPTGSSQCFPGLICRGTHRNRVFIVMHFRVCGAERRWETRFLFLSALEVFIRSRFPLLSFKYCLSSLGTIYIFNAFPFESSPLLRRFMVLACPTIAFASMLEGMGRTEMRWRCHFTRLAQEKPKEMWRDVLEVLWTQ